MVSDYTEIVSILQESIMPTLSEFLQRAQTRARHANLPYEGALTPLEADFIWQHAPGAKLVDVRSHAELELVGFIPGAILLEWQTFPGWQLNPYFLPQLKQQVDKEALVMFICRSGGRSHQSAVLAHDAGYTEVYNVLEGFEGDKNALHRRGLLNGWKAAGLTWEQK
jgi:rhodanese-related sulfurtransferase